MYVLRVILRNTRAMRLQYCVFTILTTATLLLFAYLPERTSVWKYKDLYTPRREFKPINLRRPSFVSENKISPPVPVLILSYMRSGSTFISDVIASHPSSLFIFEPFSRVIPKIRKKAPIVLINGTVIIPIPNEEATLLSELLFSWLTCNYGGLDSDIFLNLPITHSSTKKFHLCLKTNQSQNNETVLHKCIKILQTQCESIKLRVVKTIRLRMRTTVENVLERIPGLKVIHLFRDQRPRLLSAERTPTMLFKSLQATAKSECSNALDDIVIHQELERTYPGQLATVLYEKLAENPLAVSNRIFEFLQLSFTRKSFEYIKNITSSTTEVTCSFCTKKKNSSKTAHAWRTQKFIDFDKIKMIQRECKETHNVLGYLPLNSTTEMRNTSINLRMSTPFTADAL